MKVIYTSDYEQFPGGAIKPREKLVVETTVEEAADWEIVGEINTSDSSWQADLFLPNQINVTASSSADCISPGENVVVSFVARAPGGTDAG